MTRAKTSFGVTGRSFRPKFSRSARLGCAPTATPASCAARIDAVMLLAISGMKSAGDVGGTDQREQFALARRALAEIRIQVDRKFHAARRRRPTRKRCRSFSRSTKSATASARVTSRKRTESLGRSWAAMRQIYRDHVRDSGVTADGLAISEQNDRLAVVRHLDRSRGNGFGKSFLRPSLAAARYLRAALPSDHISD